MDHFVALVLASFYPVKHVSVNVIGAVFVGVTPTKFVIFSPALYVHCISTAAVIVAPAMLPMWIAVGCVCKFHGTETGDDAVGTVVRFTVTIEAAQFA